jgi:hypothetical protein
MLILDWERPFSCSWTLFVMSMSEVFSIMNHWINGVCKEHLWTWGEWLCVIFGFKLHCILLIYTQRKKLSTRWQIIGMHTTGMSFKAIGRQMGYHYTVVSRLVRKHNHPLATRPVYMDDNARPRRSRAVTAYIQSEAVTSVPWPTMSPVWIE